MRSPKKTLIFSIILVISILVALECLLQVFSWISPKAKDLLARTHNPLEETIEDERLGWRGNPRHPEHDPKGFRNKGIAKNVDIIAMGDSQTYGVGVAPDQAWPQQLARLGTLTTYNMGVSGYSPLQSLLLLEEAINLKPKLIIEAFYTGNDLYESFYLVYKHESYGHKINYVPDLKSTDKQLLLDIEAMEHSSPLQGEVDNLFKRGHPTLNIKKTSQPQYGSWREFLSKHSSIYGMLRAIKNLYNISNNRMPHTYENKSWELAKKEVLGMPDFYQVFENNQFHTVFTPYIRSLATNIKDIRIAEGHHICLEIFKRMRERTQAVNIEFIVLFIPTKELVFKNVVFNERGSLPQAYTDVIAQEEFIWEKSKQFLREHSIPFLDALPDLRERLSRGDPSYFVADNHLNIIGQWIMASTVLSDSVARFHLR